MRAIPVPVRQRILQLYEAGKDTRQIAEFSGYCVAAVRRVRQQLRERGTLEPQTQRCGRKTLLTARRQARLQKLVVAQPDATLTELGARLDRQVAHQNATVCRTTGHSPNAAWDKALAERRTAIRPCPPTALLDLHLALHLRRRVHADYQMDFLGRSWPIAPTKRATVTLIHHPLRQFWAVAQPPLPPQNNWPEILGNYSL